MAFENPNKINDAHIPCDNDNILQFEQTYVHDVYNTIADSFSATRYKPWAFIKEYLQMLPTDSIMVDVGCGNGKYLGISRGQSIGCDMCDKLLQIASKKGYEVMHADALALPIADEFADCVISIAVIHHFASLERRLNAVREMLRITKVGGEILIYVWSVTDTMGSSTDKFVKWSHQTLASVTNRYYHFFAKGELEALCLTCGGCEIIKSYFDKENWACLVRKL